MKNKFNAIIVGCGAAGLMCAIEIGKRGKKVCVIEHSGKIGEKIRISGGGKCNFTNINTSPSNFISQNPHFSISALNQYTYKDFLKLLSKHNIKFYEKKLGQLFCRNSSQEIIDMLLSECVNNDVQIKKNTLIKSVSKKLDYFELISDDMNFYSESLIIATGGLSIPKIGASSFGYDLAKKFELKVVETSPALVPFVFKDDMLNKCQKLAGVSINAEVYCDNKSFAEGFLFTHKGISGPSILQISSYWKDKKKIIINLCPDINIINFIKGKKKINVKQNIISTLNEILPKSLLKEILPQYKINLSEISEKDIQHIDKKISNWAVYPHETEGYRTAEVTLGGVCTSELSSKTMESKKIKGLYFIGEVVDVTGHLGGYNFQWAWSSGYVAGNNVLI